MKRISGWLSSAALVASGILAGSAQGAIPIDVSNDVIRCNTVIATVTVNPALSFADTPSPATFKIKGKIGGCTDITNPAVIIDSGSVKGTLVGMTNDCLALTESHPVTGSLTYKWKANRETPILQTSSVQTIDSFTGGSFSPAAADPAFASIHLSFTLGTSSVTGAFTGGDAGATSTNLSVTSENSTFFSAGCSSLAADIKTIHVGLGTITLR